MAVTGGAKSIKVFSDSLPIGVAIIGIHGTIVSWDRRAVKLFNLNVKDAIGLPIVSLFPDSSLILQKYLDIFTNDSKRTRRKIFFRKNKKGVSQYIEITFSELQSSVGDAGIMLMFRDVTKEKRTNLERKRIEIKNKILFEQVKSNREKLKSLISNIPGVVWEAEKVPDNKKLKIKFVSRYIEKMMGYSIKEWISGQKNELDLFDGAVQKGIEMDMSKVYLDKRRKGVTQYLLKRKDNKALWIESHYSAVVNDKNEIEGLQGVMLDISKRKKIEEALQKSEERFRMIFELAPDVIYSLDINGKFQELNPAFEKVTGFKRRDWIGRSYLDLTHPDDRDFAKKNFEDGIAGHTSDPYELRLSTSNGNFIVAEFRSRPRIVDGKVSGKLGIFRDITYRKHEERQRSYMLGIASHELKTPLASIKVFTQILQKKFKKEKNLKYDEYLIKIDQQINKLSKLISDLLDIERIKAGRLEVAYEIFDFDKLVNEVVEEVSPTLVSHKIILKGSTKRYIMGDKGRISRVISNLLSNASKYSPGKDKIILSLSSTFKAVTISIQDFGIGISKDNINKIFEPFYHSNINDNKKIPSVGLGLYISSEIIRVHGGKLWVESELNKGSTFFLSLPIKQKN
jgi:PAS domain S-box-containing protein